MGNKMTKAKADADSAKTSGNGKGKSAGAAAEPSKKITVNDFDMISVLGRGAFGKVTLVKKKGDATNQLFALKSLKKADLVNARQVEHTTTERYVLEQINSPFLVHLSFAFQTPEKLYIVMDYLTGGELFFWLKKHHRFTEVRAKLYMAECVLAIEAMHDKDIIHRDLKPENILLDKEGHLKIVDYGLAKGGITSCGGDDGGVRTKTFCGTPEYVSPELIENRGHGKGVDWWALGAIMYEMLYGLPPFYDTNVTVMYKKILHDELKFKADVAVSSTAKAFIRKMLVREVMQRMGSRDGSVEVKGDAFFNSLEFKKVAKRSYVPEFVPPKQKNDADTRNFEKEFTDERPADSLASTTMTESMAAKANFEGFTFTDKDAP